MNLKDLIDEVGLDLDNDPSFVAAVRNGRARIINRGYLQLSQQYPWMFLERESTIAVYGPFEPSATQFAIFTNAAYEVTFSGTTALATWVGQTIVGADAANYTVAAVNTTTNVLYLTTAYAGATTIQTVDWSITFERVYMPTNCADVLGFIDRDNNHIRLVHLGRRTEEFLALDRTDAGDALAFIEDDWQQDRPPDYPPTLAQNATVGGLTNGTTYQYCYTFYYRGMETAPSPVAEIINTGTSVAISGLENTLVGALTTGKYKYIYRRDKTRNGRWQRLNSLFSETDGATGTLVDIGTGIYFATQNELFESQPIRTFRVWMRPGTNGTAQTVYFRYKGRVRRLYADADVPLWPAEYHHLLVYQALVDLYLQAGDDTKAQLRQRSADILLKRMREQCLSTPDERFVRGSWGGGGWGGQWVGPISSDFSG